MKRLLLMVFIATITAAGPAPPALAQSRCVVSDPTGTPMNVRAHPNGPILGALHNGAVVQVLDMTSDGGRPALGLYYSARRRPARLGVPGVSCLPMTAADG